MKKIISKILAFLGALVLVFSLAGCDKSNAIKKAFEKADYNVEVVDENNDLVKVYLNLLDEEDREEAAEYEFIVVSSGFTKSGLIIKYPSTKDLKEALNTEDNPDGYKEAKEEGLVNGNCLLSTLSSDVKEIFKNA